KAGVRLLSDHVEIQLVEITNPRPAEEFRALLRERRGALARVLESLPADAAGISAQARLEELEIIQAAEIRIKDGQHWYWCPPDLDPVTVQAHAAPEGNKLFLTDGKESRYWAVVARSLLSVLSPETEASSLSAPIMSVLSARSLK